jgi:glutamine synthetase
VVQRRRAKVSSHHPTDLTAAGAPVFEPSAGELPKDTSGSNGEGRIQLEESTRDLAFLQRLVERDTLNTIVVAGVDFQGRLFGKNVDARHFVRSSPEGTYASVAALANDIRLDLVEGLSFGGWQSGFPDVLLRPDYSTARVLSWRPGTALLLADIVQADGRQLESSPRAVLRRVLARSAALGLKVYSGSELEFYLLRETAESARDKNYSGLQMVSNFPADYNLLRSSRDERFFRFVRNSLAASGIPVESSKPEWGHSQGELNLAYAEALEMGDRHVIFKHAVKEMAELNELLVTFMAKPFTDQPGSGCHLHMSLRARESDEYLFYDPDAPFGMSTTMRHFLGGVQQLAGELFLLYAPYVNSYKRFIPGNFAPCRNIWGIDNRTSAFRVAGRGPDLRVENRIPGADVNGYLASAAMLASGMYGLQHGLEPLQGPGNGNICDLDAEAFPANLAEAVAALEASQVARELLGDALVDDLLAFAQAELKAYFTEVTDWERRAYLEQI